MRGMADGGQTSGHGAQDRDVSGCLFEAEGVRLYHFPALSDHALVLFAEGPSGARLHRNWVNGAGHAAVDLYEVLPRQPGLYPPQDMRTVSQIIAETNSRPAVAIGAETGGHAALRYARQAGCAAALAFSPLGVVPSGDPAAGPDLLQEDLPPLAWVAFDPERVEDALQAEALRLLDGVCLVRLPHIGHRSERVMVGDGLARRIFAAMLNGQRFDVARLLRHARVGDDGFLSRLSLACSRQKHFQWAADIAAKGHPERQHLPDLAMARAEALAGLGAPLEAVETLEHLIVSAPQSPRYWTLLVDRYEAMGQDEAAAEVLELALSVTENFGFCWRLIRKLAGMGGAARMQARALAEMAMEHWPDRSDQTARLLKAIPAPP